MGAAVKPLRGKTRRRATVPRKGPTSPLDRAAGYEVAWRQVSDLFNAARDVRDCRFVYFIGEDDDGPVKIGTAKDPVARLRGMQTGNPRRLRVEHVLLGDMPIEKLLHEFWEPYAVASARSAGKPNAAPGTEWFRSEVRAELFPIIETAAREQVAFLATAEGTVMFESLERVVRQAHIAHGFVAKGRDEVRLLATVGYAINRPSRI